MIEQQHDAKSHVFILFFFFCYCAYFAKMDRANEQIDRNTSETMLRNFRHYNIVSNWVSIWTTLNIKNANN